MFTPHRLRVTLGVLCNILDIRFNGVEMKVFKAAGPLCCYELSVVYTVVVLWSVYFETIRRFVKNYSQGCMLPKKARREIYCKYSNSPQMIRACATVTYNRAWTCSYCCNVCKF